MTCRGVRLRTPASRHSLRLTALAATACISGPPCIIGKTALSIAAACSALQTNIAAARAAQHLVRGEGDDVGVGHRARDRLAGDQADEVRGVDPEDRADLVGEGAEAGEVDQPRDGRAAGEDHLGPVLAGRASRDLVVVDVLGLLVDAVVHGVEPLAARRTPWCRGSGGRRAAGVIARMVSPGWQNAP